ncbi:MAG: TenA family protein [Pseudoruegeria sp.]
MRPTEKLKSMVLKDWHAATYHPFCRDLAQGTLPLNKMRWYLVQDYQFVDGFIRLLARAISHAPTLKDAIPMAQFLGLVTSEENTYFLRSFDALGVTKEKQEAAPAKPTAEFQALMARAADSGDYAQMLAVLVVAEWSYLEWAAPFLEQADTLPFYFGEWITLHAGEGFEGVVAHLRSQLDAIWPSLSPENTALVEATFSEAIQLERAFFDAAYLDRD